MGARMRECPCGSGKESWWEYDARGIELCRVCDDCKEEKLSHYRKEVLSDPNYEADEPIEDDDYPYDDYDDEPEYGDYETGPRFADPGGRSSLRAETPYNPRNIACPSCGQPNRLTAEDVGLGYQCDSCADKAERGLAWDD